jgi:hypothetical protein
MTVPTHYIEVDWDNDLRFRNAYSNITPELRKAFHRRGRSDATQILGKASPGEFEGEFRSPSSRYNQFNAASPLYGDIEPRRAVRVRSGVPVEGVAADFEASNSEWLSVADSGLLSPGNTDFAIAVWAWLESKPGGGDMTILGKWNVTGNQCEYVLYCRASTDHRFAFSVSDDGSFASVPIVESTDAPSIGAWYFVIVWHDATANTINLQVNNGTANSQAHTTGVFKGTALLELGRQGSAIKYWDGRMALASFWNRTLTAAEKTWLYNEGKGRRYDELAISRTDGSNLLTSLVAYWNLDEASGQRNDSHINLLHLTDNNTVTSAAGLSSVKLHERWAGYLKYVNEVPVSPEGPLSTIRAEGALALLNREKPIVPLLETTNRRDSGEVARSLLDGSSLGYRGAVMLSEPKAYFRLNHTADPGAAFIDETGQHKGIYGNTPLLEQTSLIDGVDDNSIRFRSAQSEYFKMNYLAAPTSQFINIGGTNPWSFEFLVDVVTWADARPILECAIDATNQISLAMYLTGGVRELRAVREVAGVTVGTATANSNRFNTGRTIHVALTYNGATLKLYVDGELFDSVADARAWPTVIGPEAMFWAADDALATFSDIILDEIAVYESALSDEEVSRHYQLAKRAPWVVGQGQSRISPYYAGDLTILEHLREVEDTEMGFLHELASGQIAFEERRTRLDKTASEITFSDDAAATYQMLQDVEATNPWDNVINHIELDVKTFSNIASGVVWSAEDVPMALQTYDGGEIYNFKVIPALAEGEFIRVWDTVPVASITFKHSVIYEGEIFTNSVTQVGPFGRLFNLTAVDAEYEIASPLIEGSREISWTEVTLNSVQISASKISTNTEERYVLDDRASQRTFGIRSYPGEIKFLSSRRIARSFMRLTIEKWKQGFRVVTVPTPASVNDTNFEGNMGVEISDRITLDADGLIVPLGLTNKAFYVDAVEESFTAPEAGGAGGYLHFCRYVCSPAEFLDSFWRVGTAVPGVTTRVWLDENS